MKSRAAQVNSHRDVLPSQSSYRYGNGRKLIVIIAMLIAIGLLVWHIG